MDSRFRWVAVVGMAAIALGVGFVAYNAGVSHGMAIGAPAAGTPQALPPYGFYRPWGFGFGPFFALLFLLVIFRGLLWGPFWGPGWHRGFHGPAAFEEWHRRAHEWLDAQAKS